MTCYRHFDILAKTLRRMTTAITSPPAPPPQKKNDASARVSNTQYWEDRVLVVVLVSESKAL